MTAAKISLDPLPTAPVEASSAEGSLGASSPDIPLGEQSATDPLGPLPPLQGTRGEEIYSLDIPEERIISRYIEGLLAERREWLQAVLSRSNRYRLVIMAELADRSLPRELRFLPAVESGFQTHAVSPRGAVGLWQLMRNTASPYGLRMDQWVDERRDFMRSTDASLQKLQENFNQFGDWFLALAAYNCGVGRMTRITARYPGQDFWDLRRKGVLPRETAAFVPMFLAIAQVLSYPGRYGLEVSWDPSPDWARIPLDTCIDLRILSRESGVPLDVLASSNPELNFPVTPPASYQYVLKVPEEYEQAVKETLASATVPLMEFNVHVVKSGDTLSEMALRYHVTVDMILQFNPRLSPRTLQIGTKVLIPMTPRRSEG
ncbi:MAG TPA: transglycosylase SLT domain-containing protein [Spirochaetia bacterium]|nr:transglycosylase SLT domain-containing protein [Spirochaetia bacterium]